MSRQTGSCGVRPEAILVLDPEWIIRDVGPAMIVGVRKAAVARKAERKIQIAVLAGNAAIAGGRRSADP